MSRVQHIGKFFFDEWCKNVYQKYVFTYNAWRRCPEKDRTAQVEDKLPTELLVAAIKNAADFRHDCLSVTPKGRLVEKSYVSHILGLLQEVLSYKIRVVVVNGKNGTVPHGPSIRRNMIELISQEEADVGACHIQPSPQAVRQVDFLLPTLTTSRSLVYIPKKLPLEEDVFVETFSGELWACFFAAFILLILCFRLSTWLHSKVQPNHEPWSWIEVVLWAVAAVCQQSYSRYPKGLSCRTTFIIGYLITYLLYTGFAAGVTSLLAVQSTDVNLDFDDVLEMKLTVITARSAQNPFIEGLAFISQGLKQGDKIKRIKTEVVRSNTELFKRLSQENVVGYGYTPSLEHHMVRSNRKKFDYHISRLPHPRFHESLPVRKNFPHKNRVNVWLLKMMEHGLLDVGRSRYIENHRDSCCDEVAWSSASLFNVYSAILLLTSGHILSVFILFAEMAWMKKVTGTKWEAKAKQDILSRCSNG